MVHVCYSWTATFTLRTTEPNQARAVAESEFTANLTFPSMLLKLEEVHWSDSRIQQAKHYISGFKSM